ncbi:MAG: hypothetical protein WAK17_28020 [Candidatus Nitrosopolaris sp.]|jgi:hypothetical protein
MIAEEELYSDFDYSGNDSSAILTILAFLMEVKDDPKTTFDESLES